MSNVDSLSPDEARSMRRWGAAARSALVVTFVVDVALARLGQDLFVWLAEAVPGILLCLFLFGRYWRCPRCGQSVSAERHTSDGDDGPGRAVFGRLLPDRCRACGVRLTPSVRTDPTT